MNAQTPNKDQNLANIIKLVAKIKNEQDNVPKDPRIKKKK
jgi:hypothetical protein